MYSLNVPLPESVRDLADDLRPSLSGFESVRESRDRTLLLKRLPATDRRELLDVEAVARDALADADPVEARIDGLDAFWDPPFGRGPVVYLAVESPGLQDLHRRLVDALGAEPDVEGDDYIPHVTLARGGDPSAVRGLLGREVASPCFTVDTLSVYDTDAHERLGSLSLRG
ncbi:MAG: 2'-5' RNA ligase family protein [Halodesulfurarchaeum sp.]